MKHSISLALTILCLTLVSTAAGAQDFDPSTLPPQEFLAYARRPFVNNAWGRFHGRVQHKREGTVIKRPVYLGVLFKQDFMRAQVVLDRKHIYNVMQVYFAAAAPLVTVAEPDTEPEVSLADLGIKPDDITFSFLYWTFVEEQESTSHRGQQCRVMKLRNDKTSQYVICEFSANYFFPLKVAYYSDDSDTPSRTIEFTDFEKHGDIYYVKEMRLHGNGWKTRVQFRDGDIFKTDEKQAPPNLFYAPQNQ